MFKKRKRHKVFVQNQEWYVVFCDSDQIGAPWRWFTREGFRHCLCFAAAPEGVVILNYTQFHYEVRLAAGQNADDFAFGMVNAGCKVLKVVTNKSPKFVFRAPLYCVSLTKACLGLRGCWAVTPKQLHCWLKKSKLEIIDYNLLKEQIMGKPPKPVVDPDLERQRKEQQQNAEREAERLRQERIGETDRLRRQKGGLFSLIKTEGGELGAKPNKLGVSA